MLLVNIGALPIPHYRVINEEMPLKKENTAQADVKNFIAIKIYLMLVNSCFKGILRGMNLMVSAIKITNRNSPADAQICMAIKTS